MVEQIKTNIRYINKYILHCYQWKCSFYDLLWKIVSHLKYIRLNYGKLKCCILYKFKKKKKKQQQNKQLNVNIISVGKGKHRHTCNACKMGKF